MKKLLTILIVCMLCVCCAVSFTACDFNSQQNTGNEITNEQPENKDNNEEQEQNQGGEENNNGNNEEEKVVIDKDTDFDALESDKVEKYVFINACVSTRNSTSPYFSIKINGTFEITTEYMLDGRSEKSYHTLKCDGLERFISERDENSNTVSAYMLLADDLKSYIAYVTGQINGKSETRIEKGDLYSYIQDDTEFAEKIWENAVYNETTKQYEILQFDVDEYNTVNNLQIKIKDGYMVFYEYTDMHQHVRVKCYDIGTTVVDIPADILAAMNTAK